MTILPQTTQENASDIILWNLFSALCNGVWHYETTKELGIDALNVCEVNNIIHREQ